MLRGLEESSASYGNIAPYHARTRSAAARDTSATKPSRHEGTLKWKESILVSLQQDVCHRSAALHNAIAQHSVYGHAVECAHPPRPSRNILSLYESLRLIDCASVSVAENIIVELQYQNMKVSCSFRGDVDCGTTSSTRKTEHISTSTCCPSVGNMTTQCPCITLRLW